MKTKTWILFLAALFLLCSGLGIYFFLPRDAAASAQIFSDRQIIKTVSLAVDQEFTVTTPEGGSNTVSVKNGKIAVTQANCPDGYCMERGFCNQGTQIVCLPNHLVISFVGGSPTVDAVAG